MLACDALHASLAVGHKGHQLSEDELLAEEAFAIASMHFRKCTRSSLLKGASKVF
jgi:hypothetical protein